ncbi:MAG: hypothetical protein K2G03_07150 [Bacilli bacterium]|nr:hypothetical protein [Bacilli bacterium]
MKKQKIGAIRWDAWVGDANPVGLEVENTLSNPKYKNRLPFYSKMEGDSLKIRCTDKDTIRKEIEYASTYGIDYFAFCWYPNNSGLDIARKIFLEINQNTLKWCLILGTNPFTLDDADWLIKEFSKESYLKIDNRPVIYLFNVNSSLLEIVNYLRANSNYKPYFVGLVWNFKQAKEAKKIFDLDALSQYSTPGQNNISYKELGEQERNRWQEYLNIAKVVPWVTSGWDKRPRFEFPVSWENCQNFDKEYIEFPTMDELKLELESAIDFALKNASDLILIYAWNEFDEGGFIAPTLNNKSINLEKLKSIREVIDKKFEI